MALVFVHSGYSPYLEYTLRQARAASPGSDVVLLGDAGARLPFVRAVRPSDSAAVRELRATYRHRSTNHRPFELGCFERWVHVRDWMAREGHADAFVLDSDVLLFTAEDDLRRTWTRPATALGLSVPTAQSDFRWLASPHVAYVRRETLDAFCEFMTACFRPGTPPGDACEAKWAHHLATGAPGGVVDMTALYLFWNTLAEDARANLCTTRGGATCDLNVNTSENEVEGEFAMRRGRKSVIWTDGTPTGTRAADGGVVRLHALHLQGKAKRFIPALYRGPVFGGARRLALAMSAEYAARRAAARVMQPVRLLCARLAAQRRV